MGVTRRRFTIGFKQQVVGEIESGLLRPAEAARKYEIAASVIERWRWKAQSVGLVEKPSMEEKKLRMENEQLKKKVGELTLQIDHLKKLEDYVRQRRRENMSVITGRNLVQFKRGVA